MAGGAPIPDLNLNLNSSARSGASMSGDLFGPRITFGTSAPGFTTVQLFMLVSAVVAVVWIWKKVK